MKIEFKFKGIHAVDTAVVLCMDFRFQKETQEFFGKELGINNFDLIAIPGAGQAIIADDDLALKSLAVSNDLHHVKKIIVVHHQDCGAYGGSGKFNGDAMAEESFHKEELQKTKEKINSLYPNLEVTMVFARLTDDSANIEFVIV
ncbi:MAG: carbonic anhydrase [Patescibacteria group bacterium]|nr:carbonic anhydrase [Patescibacteria group bacterium]MDD4610382.1 carbonic anhydrase [Patescibacteria group bacterium]